MKLNVGFEELARFVEQQWKQKFAFEQISDRELKLTFIKKVLIKNLKVSVGLTFLRAEGSVVTVAYDGRFGIDMIIGGALSFIREQFPEVGSLMEVDGKKITVDLANFDKLRPVFDKLRLEDISVRQDSLEVKAVLK